MKKAIIKNFGIFWMFSLLSFKTTFQGRLGIFFFTIGKIFRFLFFFGFIMLIFSRTKLIKGYGFNHAVIFYLTYNLIDTITQTFFREVYRFRPYVLWGFFNQILLKPYHPFLRVLVGGVDFLDMFLIIPYFCLTIFFILKIQGITILSFFFYLIFIINSLIIATAFHIMVLALGILTTEIDHTMMIYRDIVGLGRFPMDIYKEPIRGIFTFIVPVGIMMSVPAQALFGLLNWKIALYSVLISIGLFFLSIRLWGFALKKYQSWGG